MSSRIPLAALALFASLASGCGGARGHDGFLVFAASSLADVAPELGEAFTAQTGTLVQFSFGSSAALARQVAAGAPADLLLSADLSVHSVIVDRMPYEGAYLGFANNELVLVAPAAADWPAEGLAAVARVAVGDWRASVPVGLAAREWLSAEGSWDELAERLVPCVDARATLAAVASGSVEAGIVYATDAASSDAVRIVGTAGAAGPVVRYVAFELDVDRTSAHPFGRFLTSPEAEAIFLRHGFAIEGTAGRSGSR